MKFVFKIISMNISILGTGNIGAKLGKLLLENSYTVYYGSRRADNVSSNNIVTYQKAIEKSDIIILAIPYFSVSENLRPVKQWLRNKIIIDATNPLNADWSPLLLGQENSAGEEIYRLLDESKVVKCFNTVFADNMTNEGTKMFNTLITAFLCGDDEDANKQVASIAKAINFEPLIVGGIKYARYLEAMAHMNIQLAIGKGYGTKVAYKYLMAQ
jgi:8-hydroxy-5-deazaflavin:NADPH oxidoreductase